MKRLAITLALFDREGSKNATVPYTPIPGDTARARAEAVRQVASAIAGAGKDVAALDVDAGVVTSTWFAGAAALVGDQTRFRVRAKIGADGGYTVAAQCQRREVLDATKWTACADDAKRPRFVVETIRAIERALR